MIRRYTTMPCAGVAAIALAVLAVPAIALAAPGHPGATRHAAVQARAAALGAAAGREHAATPAAAPACRPSQLVAWLGIPGSGAAGSIFYELELSNVSRAACTLYGYPGVSAVGLGGSQLGSPAARDHADGTALVTLRRGQTAHALLQITDPGFFSAAACRPSAAIGLRVYAPNTATALTVPFSFRACSRPGPVYLHVRTTVSGTGIPFFSA